MSEQTAAAAAAPARTAGRSRILGVDAARAVAIVGMVAVHVGPERLPGGGLWGAAYRSAHGRASILFVLLAGVGVSLLAGDRSRARLRRTWARLLWRAAVLLPVGLLLQALYVPRAVGLPDGPTVALTSVNVAVILQYYAVFFLVAAAVVVLGDRWLWALAATAATVGAAALVWLAGVAPQWFPATVPPWDDVARVARDLALTGFYPVIVWMAPLLVGMVIGRRDLRDAATARTLIITGAAVAAAGFALSDLSQAILGEPSSAADWRRLALVTPHSEMTLWVVTATAIAVATLGCCLVLAARFPGAAWPVAALGQLAFTVYVGHLLVLAVAPQWLTRDAFGSAATSLLRFTIVATLLAVAWRAVAPRGPFEALLRPPWQSATTRTRPPTTRPPAPGSEHVVDR